MLASIDFSQSTEFRGQMMMLAGIALLIWVLFRRSMRAGRERRKEALALAADRRRMDGQSESAAPLANAPVDILRWQGAMFDLQRELLGELETRMYVVQSLVQLADERIDSLRGMCGTDPAAVPLGTRAREVHQLTAAGQTAAQIATALRIPLGDVEFLQNLALPDSASVHYDG